MLINLIKTVPVWDVCLPLLLFIITVFGAIHVENNQIRIASISLAIGSIARFLYVIKMLPVMWWEIVCYFCLAIIAIATFFVRFRSPASHEFEGFNSQNLR